MRDSHKRSWVKTGTWRVIATAITIVGFGVATGDWKVAGGVGLAVNLIKAILYYAHERSWEHIKWGRKV